jgi:hypothetical protein
MPRTSQPEPVPDVLRVLAMYQRRYNAIPAEDREANLNRERAVRARLAQRSKRHARAA